MVRILVFALLFYAIQLQCCYSLSYVPMTDGELSEMSHSVIVGEVKTVYDQHPDPLMREGARTHYNVQIIETLKESEKLRKAISTASPSTSEIIVSVIGGKLAGNSELILHVPGVPSFSEGDRVILFLHHDDDQLIDTVVNGKHEKIVKKGLNQIRDLSLGVFYEYGTYAVRGVEKNLFNSIAKDIDLRRSPVDLHEKKIPENGNKPVTIARTFSEFSNWLKNLNNGIDKNRRNMIEDYWTEIDFDEISELDAIHNNKKRYEIYGVRWTNTNIHYMVQSIGDPAITSGGFPELRKAFDQWQNEPNTPIVFTSSLGNVNKSFSGNDNINGVVWNDLDNAIPGVFNCETKKGALAKGGYWATAATHNWRGVPYHAIVEAALTTQEGTQCYYDQFDSPSTSFTNMLTHEIGHTLGIQHSCGDTNCNLAQFENAVMRSFNNPDSFEIQYDDRLVLQMLYSSCFPNCPNFYGFIDRAWEEKSPTCYPKISNIIMNGDFESSYCALTKDYCTYGVGSGGVIGWTISDNAVDVVINKYMDPQSGNRSIDLSGSAPGKLSQTVNTVYGVQYNLSFYMSGNYLCGDYYKVVIVTISGISRQFSFPIGSVSARDMNWKFRGLTFVAGSATTTISFKSNDSSGCGPMIDNVALVPSNLIVNGDFEIVDCKKQICSYSIPSGQFVGDANLWTISSGDIEFVHESFWKAQSGVTSIDLNGIDKGSIWQSPYTIEGVTYSLTFWLSANNGCGFRNMQIKVQIAESKIYYDNFDTAGRSYTNMSYVQREILFKGIGRATPITISSMFGGMCGPVLDNIRLAPTCKIYFEGLTPLPPL